VAGNDAAPVRHRCRPAGESIGIFINAVCKLNSIPFDTTGQHIDRDGGWTGYEFSMQLDTKFGPDRMLCHGSIEPAFGMAEGQPAVRMMRTCIYNVASLMRSRQVFVILQVVWPLNLLFDGLTDFHYGSSFRREIAMDRASTVVTASVAKPSIKLSHSRRNFYRDRACGLALGNDCRGCR